MSSKTFPEKGTQLSRRDFLSLSGLSLFGFFLPPIADFRDLISDQQGRVASGKITLYDVPSFKGREVKVYWKDTVLPIVDAIVGDKEPGYNRIWYRMGEEGYAHSGGIQPVKTLPNLPVENIPKEGVLAEVTVPYTDAHWGPGINHPFAYRFYYETTYWITKLVHDNRDDPWYRILDDKWDFTFYVPATHLRVIPRDELTPISPDVHPAGKRIEVRTNEQLVIAYEWDRPVFMARAATGADFSNGRFRTPPGRHITFHKRPSRHMTAGNLAANGFDLPGVPWIAYITDSGVAFHGTYWHNDFGQPRSHGCINLTPKASKWIYRWTLPVVPPDQQRVYEDYGTAVDVI